MKEYVKKVIILGIVLFSVQIGVGAVEEITKYIKAEVVPYQIKFGEEKQEFEMPIVTIEDRTYVPLREWCEKTETEIRWNEEKGEIRVMEGMLNTGFQNSVEEYKYYDTIDITKETAIAIADSIFKQDFDQEYFDNTEIYIFESEDKKTYSVCRIAKNSEDMEKYSPYAIKIRKSDCRILEYAYAGE